jgi:hypothetical protein
MKKTTLKFFAFAMIMLMGSFVMAQTQYELTFNVDMTDSGFDAATHEVFMSGSFAGWAEPGSDMNYKMEPTEAGSMIYTLTTMADSGEVMFKYFTVEIGGTSWAGGEWDGDPNRVWYTRENITFDHVWGEKPQTLTFNVDMSTAESFDPATQAVYIAGSMASGWAQPGTMSKFMLTSTDDVNYTLDLTVGPGDWMYKYFLVTDGVPSWDGGEWEGDPNREVTIDTLAVALADTWGEIAGIFDGPNEFTYSMYPNPVLNVLNIDNTADVTQIDVYDASGRMVRTVEVSTNKVTIDVADLQTGVYIVNVYNEKGTQTSKFIKN